MKPKMLIWGLVVLSGIGRQVSAQVDPPVIEIAELRASVRQLLLNEEVGPDAVVLDHLWKSNGGALLPRDPSEPASSAFATQLVERINYDPATGTLVWPVYGFADRLSARFQPVALWPVFGNYFAQSRMPPDEVLRLQNLFVEEMVARPVVVDPLVPPRGLTVHAEQLLQATGYYGSRLFVYSSANCFDVAVKCYLIGRFDDSRVLLSHAIAQHPEPKYYYLRGTIEMLTGIPDDARMSALGFVSTSLRPPFIFRDSIYERINNPASAQFRDLVTEVSRPVPAAY